MPLSSSASTLSSSGSSNSSAMQLPPLSSSSSSAAATSPLGADELRLDCGYCANGKTLRDILPPKKCDYCFKFKCQFCTLRFPLIKVRKGLPKAMKGNSRICLHCFHSMWTDHTATGALSSGAEMASSTRRASLGRRESLSSAVSTRAAPAWGDDDDATAYDEASLRESMLRDSFNTGGRDSLSAIDEVAATTPPAPPSATQRVARALGLVIRADTPQPQDVVHVVDLWLSLFAAATLLVVVLVDNLTLQQRVAFCVVIYGGFLAVHPWIHNVTVTTPTRTRAPSLSRRRSSVSSKKAIAVEPKPELVPRPVAIAPSTTVPDVYRPTLVKMRERFARYVNDPTQWKLVKTTSGGKIYEIPNELPQALFMLDMFISGISIDDFLNYMNRTDLKDRAVWDWNVAAFEIVEEYKDEHTCIVYNAQKAFMGGIVSARDFCLLYNKSPTTTIYASVEHAKVPERQGSTRGTVHLAGLNCTPATNDKGESGFQLQYMVQVDIGGSIPTRLMYNGQVDNMDKMIKSFRQAHKLFAKRAAK